VSANASGWSQTLTAIQSKHTIILKLPMFLVQELDGIHPTVQLQLS
jgi:hypothetical protein